MPGDWRIDQPRTLFTLPRPVDSASGKIKLGQVWRVQGSRKQKRAEVVVAADGECLNVYSIKSPRLLVTHALPPQAVLNCAPVCVYRPADENQPAKRFVYAATRSELGARRQQIVCFQEELPPTNATNAQSVQPPLKWTWNITDYDAEIAHIEPLTRTRGTGGIASHDLLLVFVNGKIKVLPENLQLNETADGDMESSTGDVVDEIREQSSCVEFLATCTASEAKRGLLRSRPDLAMSLNEESAVLLLITKSDKRESPPRKEYTVRICSVGESFPSRSSRCAVSTLMSWSLPLKRKATETISGKPQFTYDKTSSSIHILDQGVLSVCKLSLTTPTITASFATMQVNGDCLLPVSQATVLVFSGSRCVLYDSCYGSILAAQTINNSTVVEPSSRKRKRSKSQDGDSPVTSSLIYPNLGIIVGMTGNELLSLGISTPKKGQKKRSRNRLVNALGMRRTVSTAADSLLSFDTHRSLGLNSKSMGGVESSLDKMFCEFNNFSATEKKHRFDLFFTDIFKRFGHRLDNSIDPLARDLALKTIGVLFDWNRQDSSSSALSTSDLPSIKILYTPLRIFEWLFNHGYVTAQNIEKALFMHRISGDPFATVSDVDLVAAVAEVDPRLYLLASVVASRKLGLSGYVESFRLLIRSFDYPDPGKFDGLLEMNRLKVENGDARKLGDEFLKEEKAATDELEIATSILEDDYDMRGSALKTCLERLGTCFSLPELVQTLRHQLKQSEIMMLVELLRIELEQAGWTSRRLDFHPLYNATENQNEAISVICKLLNCALDAMGTVGWLAERQSLATDDISSQISLLRKEASSALEGVQEATFFCGFLKDFIRFGAGLGNSSSGSGRRIQMSAMLPFGLHQAQKPSTMRIGAGGELQKRSARRIGMELSQRVGKYRFETIRL